jgi:hypothetical protein
MVNFMAFLLLGLTVRRSSAALMLTLRMWIVFRPANASKKALPSADQHQTLIIP